MISGL